MAPDGDVRTAADSRHDHGLVVVAAVVNGLSGYLVLLIAARTLSPADNADFLVFWGALFALFGVLVGIAAEVTRAVHESTSVPPGPVDGGTGVLPVVARLGLLAAALVAVSAPLWAGHLFGDRALPWSALLVAGVVLFPVHCAIVGIAAGRGRWRTYALLVALDPLARLVLVVGAAVLALGQDGLVAASALAAAYWLVLVPLRRPDLGWTTQVVLDQRGFVRRILGACSASAASAVLIVGFPVLVRATTPDAQFAAAAPLLLAVSLCRAPLLVPLSVYQNVVVTRVMTRGLVALRGPALLIAAGTAVGMAAGALIGPWALRLVNPDYHVGRATVALLVLAAGLVCLLTLTGAGALALDRHRLYVLGWVVASLVAVAVLATPYDLTPRAVASLLIAPVVGTAVHLVGLRGTASASPGASVE